MKATKIVKQEIDLAITEITLLSREEYKTAKNVISYVKNLWWLRSPATNTSEEAGIVCLDGWVDYDIVDDDLIYVRPALRIHNLKASGLDIGNKFSLADYDWTIISNDLALCDDIVGRTCFRKHWGADDANVYDASDVKVWLGNWASENGIVVNVVKK